MSPLTLEELKQQEQKFKKSNLLKGDNKMGNRYKECTKCREMKILEDFDRDDKICEDCLDEIEIEKKAKSKEKEPVKKEPKPKKVTKPAKKYSQFKCECGETDPKMFGKTNKSTCKSCLKIRAQERIKKKAIELLPSIEKLFKTRYELTSRQIMTCLNKGKGLITPVLKELVDTEKLEAREFKHKLFYSLPGTKPKGQYEGLSDVLKEHKAPKSVLDEGVVNSMKEEIKSDKERLELKTVGGIDEDKSISNQTNKEWKEVKTNIDEEIEAKEFPPLPDPFAEPKPDPLHSIIHESYPHAEEILITPGTNEIHIKLKG